MTVSQVARSRFAAQLPDPGHLWVRFTPRNWRGPERAWTDFASGALRGTAGRRQTSGGWPEPPARPLDDVFYLPPVEASARAERDDLAGEISRQGGAAIVQTLPSEPPSAESSIAVFDLLQPLLEIDMPALQSLPQGSQAVWPLIAGVTDDPVLVRAGLEALARSGARHVQGLTLDLAPADRRWLAGDGDDEQRFARLFHSPPPSERDFAVRAHAFGFEPFLPRPLGGRPRDWPAWVPAQRRLGETLALVAELWLRLGRPVNRGQAFYRAMRYVDRCRHDLCALAREGNLGILEWLDDESRAVVEDVIATGESRLLATLRGQYLAQGGEVSE